MPLERNELPTPGLQDQGYATELKGLLLMSLCSTVGDREHPADVCRHGEQGQHRGEDDRAGVGLNNHKHKHCYKTTILCYRNIRHFPHCYKIIRQLTQYYKIITAAQFVHLQQAQILISDRLKVDNSIL